MKKALATLLSLIVLFSLCSCNNSDNRTSAPSDSSQSTTNSAESLTGSTGAPTESTEGTQPPTDEPTTPPTEDPSTPPTDEPTTPPTEDPSTPPTDESTTLPTEDPTETTTKPTDPHVHNYVAVVTEPTCTKEGYTTYTCNCGDIYHGNKTDVLGHTYGDWVTTIEPTSSKVGKAERKCSECGDVDDKELPKLVESHTHSYTASVTTAPTCTSKGVKTYACACGASYTEDIAVTQHNYKSVITSPTCDNGGYTTYTCSCGDTYVGAKTNPLGHSYKHEVTNPTCTTTGYTMHTCTRCGVYYADAKTNALGHDYKFTSETKATCTKNGSKLYACARCSVTKTETTTMLGHSYSVSSDTKATCTVDGKKVETCANCGDNKVIATYPATGHQHTKTETAEPTCSTKGYTRTVCTDCGTVISSVEKAATGCNYSLIMSGPEAAQPMLEKYRAIIATRGDNPVPSDIAYTIDQYNALYQCEDWNINVCSTCGEADFDSLTYKYTAMEAAEIMAGYINELRYEIYGTHDYDVKVCEPLMEISAIRAEEILINYTHTTETKKYGASENISMDGPTTSIYGNYLGWLNSPEHYAAMIDKNTEYFAFSAAWSAPVDLNDLDTLVDSTKSKQGGVQLFWDYMELYEYCVIHNYTAEEMAELFK